MIASVFIAKVLPHHFSPKSFHSFVWSCRFSVFSTQTTKKQQNGIWERYMHTTLEYKLNFHHCDRPGSMRRWYSMKIFDELAYQISCTILVAPASWSLARWIRIRVCECFSIASESSFSVFLKHNLLFICCIMVTCWCNSNETRKKRTPMTSYWSIERRTWCILYE